MVLFILFVAAAVVAGGMTLVLKTVAPSGGFFGKEKIGVVTIEGTIIRSRPVVSELVRLGKDDSIKAIILEINSPGGAIGPTQEIHREVQRLRNKKTVVAAMGGVAASGAYYIAAASERIVANPGTITGSIGVLMEFVRAEELLKKMGVGLEVLKSGEYKDIGSLDRTLTEKDRELLQGVIEDLQAQFVDAVAKGRGLPVEKIQEVADGRILCGARAREIGLVDFLGNFHDAVDVTKDLVGIKGDVSLIYSEGRKTRILDLLLTSAMEAALQALQTSLYSFSCPWTGALALPFKETSAHRLSPPG